MANNINREGFKRFLELGAPSFEGNIILDSGELSEYYYRFMRIPLAYGEHKVDVLYGQRFYGTLENKPVTFNQEIRFLCLVIDISITERKRSGRIQISKTNNKKTAHNIIWWAAFLEIYATITNYRIRSEWTVLHI